MLYPLVEPPFDIPFKKMKKDELAKYNEWFFEVKPFRLDILVKALNLPKEKMYSIDSLNCLGEWLFNEVSEKAKTRNFTGLASISFDAGLYLGEFIIKNHEGTCWVQNLENKQDYNYGRAVIRNFLIYDFNVIEKAFMVTNEMKFKDCVGDEFVKLYEEWKKMIASKNLKEDRFMYPLVNPPFMYPQFEPQFDEHFRNMKKDELKKYNEWFFDIKPIRLDTFARALNLPEKEMYSIGSLGHLDKWLFNEINEMKKIDDFTGLFSRSFDAGLYLGELIIKNHEGTYWVQDLGSRRFDNFGRVVIRNFLSCDDFDVIGVTFTAIWGILKGKYSDNRFVELYDRWMDVLNKSVN